MAQNNVNTSSYDENLTTYSTELTTRKPTSPKYVIQYFDEKQTHTNMHMTPVEIWCWSRVSSQSAHLRPQII